jgi:hypothetical protein
MIMNILYFNILLIHKIEFTNWNTIYQVEKIFAYSSLRFANRRGVLDTTLCDQVSHFAWTP